MSAFEWFLLFGSIVFNLLTLAALGRCSRRCAALECDSRRLTNLGFSLSAQVDKHEKRLNVFHDSFSVHRGILLKHSRRLATVQELADRTAQLQDHDAERLNSLHGVCESQFKTSLSALERLQRLENLTAHHRDEIEALNLKPRTN